MNTALAEKATPFENATHIKIKLNLGLISLKDAIEQVTPFLEEMNVMAAEIAKKYGKKHKKFSVHSFLR